MPGTNSLTTGFVMLELSAGKQLGFLVQADWRVLLDKLLNDIATA